MRWLQNIPCPPLKMGKTYGPQWVGVPQNLLRLTTIRANLGMEPLCPPSPQS